MEKEKKELKIGEIKEIYVRRGLFRRPFSYGVVYEKTKHSVTYKMFVDQKDAFIFSYLVKFLIK